MNHHNLYNLNHHQLIQHHSRKFNLHILRTHIIIIKTIEQYTNLQRPVRIKYHLAHFKEYVCNSSKSLDQPPFSCIIYPNFYFHSFIFLSLSHRVFSTLVTNHLEPKNPMKKLERMKIGKEPRILNLKHQLSMELKNRLAYH